MLTKDQIIALLTRLNAGLAAQSQQGEVGIVGGAVMCLVYNSRVSTKDVDAIFAPAETIRKLVATIAEEEGLPPDWLNDGAKSFFHPSAGTMDVLLLSHLRVWAPEPRYMLAMKCLSARWDSHDRDDVIFLLRLLEIREPQQVFSLLEHYFPRRIIPAKTQFFIEEVLGAPR